MSAPPDAAIPGGVYTLYLNFLDYESGDLVDPETVQLDITYGSYVGLVADFDGPFTYAGATTPAPDTIYRIDEGQYGFQWDVPGDAIPGVYTANWTSGYGGNGGSYLSTEDFPMSGGGPFQAVPNGDIGYWTGQIIYQPSWASSPFTIPLGTTDANGVTWILKSVTGWDGPPAVGQVIQRSADHGGWPSAQFYGPRLITLDVIASAPDQATRDIAKQQLVQAIPPSDLATFIYNEPVPKLAYVRQNGSAKIEMKFPTLRDVEFSIPLVAPDPRKYATVPLNQTATLPAPVINPLTLPVILPAGFPGSVPPIDTSLTCTNAGTFETRPTITLSGPIENPQIVNATTGQAITFTGLSLAATDQLVISTDNRQAYLNGVFTPADATSAWWVMTPGDTQVYLTGGNFSGGASITVQWSSAWA